MPGQFKAQPKTGVFRQCGSGKQHWSNSRIHMQPVIFRLPKNCSTSFSYSPWMHGGAPTFSFLYNLANNTTKGCSCGNISRPTLWQSYQQQHMNQLALFSEIICQRHWGRPPSFINTHISKLSMWGNCKISWEIRKLCYYRCIVGKLVGFTKSRMNSLIQK